MLRRIRQAPKALRWLLYGIGIVMVLGVISLWSISRDNEKANQKAQKETELVQATNPDTGSTQFVVPESRVPRTVQEAETAAPVAVSPGRWQSDPENAGGFDVPNEMPAADRKAVAEQTERFWRAWETFPSFKTQIDYSSYQRRLRPLTTPSGYSSIASRDDNHQPNFICPTPSCVGGSTPVTYKGYGSVKDLVEIRDYDPDDASVYLVFYADVRYSGKEHPLAGKTFTRSYGLVLKKTDGKWYVQRATADTVGPAQS